MVLEEYRSILSTIATAVTIPMLLSPSLICKDIIKKKNADHMKPMVFVQGLIRSSIFVQWGLLFNLSMIVKLHSLGLVLYIAYYWIYYNHCKNKTPAIKSLFKAIIFLTILLVYVNVQPESIIAKRFDIVTTVIHLTLLAMPLVNLKRVIQTKSTAGMPFPIIFMATILSLSWLLFGLSIHNNAIIFQMTISLILTSIQLSLFVIYPSKTPVSKKDQKKKKN